jgi:4'-phosphopantetheinyl transferase
VTGDGGTRPSRPAENGACSAWRAVRPGPPDALLVSRELLAEAEHAWIVRGGASGPERFLDTWVRKEAVVKCTGEGMSRDLRSFVVDAASASAAVLAPDGTETAIRTYALPVPGTAAALAVATTSPALVG